MRKILPMLEKVLAEANISKTDLDGIAYTAGPGLMGALMVGGSVATAMAYSLKIPVLGVHHMEGHLLAPMLEENPPAFPFVALLVSVGHTQLVSVTAIGEYQLLGESIGDAAGEAFDKTAKLLDLEYPGGPRLAAMAESGNIERFTFPRPMTDRPGLEFSFSGLKTYTRNLIEKNRVIFEIFSDLMTGYISSFHQIGFLFPVFFIIYGIILVWCTPKFNSIYSIRIFIKKRYHIFCFTILAFIK